MGIHDVLARLRSRPATQRQLPEVFAVLHSTDMDVHLEGVTGRPVSEPPWSSTSWERYRQARRREPSAIAKVLLDLHPAFADCNHRNPGWLDVERAETLALEWTGFAPLEVAQWLSAHPTVSGAQARALVAKGWRPLDAGQVLPDRVIDLDRRETRDTRHTG